jgi:hypothetical protein
MSFTYDDAVLVCQEAMKGRDAVEHAERVAAGVHTATAKLVAVLHEVLDGDWTVEDLAKRNVPAEVTRRVELLARDPTISYIEYITHHVASDRMATAVKLSDLACLPTTEKTSLHHDAEQYLWDRLYN